MQDNFHTYRSFSLRIGLYSDNWLRPGQEVLAKVTKVDYPSSPWERPYLGAQRRVVLLSARCNPVTGKYRYVLDFESLAAEAVPFRYNLLESDQLELDAPNMDIHGTARKAFWDSYLASLPPEQRSKFETL